MIFTLNFSIFVMGLILSLGNHEQANNTSLLLFLSGAYPDALFVKGAIELNLQYYNIGGSKHLLFCTFSLHHNI